MKLEEHGIHDRRMWQLQELVAAEIAGMTRVPAAAEKA
jgi:cation transport regulator ChaC